MSDDAVRVGVVHADRFGLLRLVPDVDLVRLHPNQSFVRQVVPAEDRQRGSDTEPLRGFDVVNLIGSDVNERRDEEHVRALALDEAEDRAIDRDGALDDEQSPRQESVPGAALEDRAAPRTSASAVEVLPRARSLRLLTPAYSGVR